MNHGPKIKPRITVLLKESSGKNDDLWHSAPPIHLFFVQPSSEMELNQRPTTGQCAESERCWSTQSYVRCLHQALPSGVRDLWGGGGKRLWEPEMTPLKQCPPDTAGLMSTGALRYCGSTPSAEKGMWTRAATPNNKRSAIDTHLQWSLTGNVNHTLG